MARAALRHAPMAIYRCRYAELLHQSGQTRLGVPVRDLPHSSFHRNVRAQLFPEDWAGDVVAEVAFASVAERTAQCAVAYCALRVPAPIQSGSSVPRAEASRLRRRRTTVHRMIDPTVYFASTAMRTVID